MPKVLENEKGITLIALLITIIILLILGGITIPKINQKNIYGMTDFIEERSNTVFSENAENVSDMINSIKSEINSINQPNRNE